MASIDIRAAAKEDITEIVFADDLSREDCVQAYQIYRQLGYITINDINDCLIINSKEHAQNLIKALEKAIELGWVE